MTPWAASGAVLLLSTPLKRLALHPVSPLDPIFGAKMNEPITPETGGQSAVSVPRGLNAAGRRLWDSSTEEFELATHELALLEEACRTRDRIVQLDKTVADDGLMLESSQGSRVHPAVSEARQQRLTLARLLATLGIPPLADDSLPPARAARGVYAMRSGH